jgi:uncharacterized protein YutE (UPF0331/DUF86 family)
MDREVVEQKLESLRRCLQRIESKCPADAQTLAEDFDLQDIVSLNLKKAVGFRNIAVHNYDAINWHIVHRIVKDHLADFSVFAKVVAL